MIEVKDKKDCCGCWACADACPTHCITMVEDKEGFRYPQVDKSACIGCGLCEKVCPVINVKPEVIKPQKAFVTQHKDEKILRESTSGGAFSAIAAWVINKGGVVFGAAFDKNFEVHHQYVETVEDLRIFRNSKYVQSRIENTFTKAREFLNSGRLVLFSGTPCQLEGLLRYLRKPYENFIAVDIMCHSVTSPGMFRSYVDLKKKELKTDSLDNVIFRDKTPYGYKYSQMSIYGNGNRLYHEGIDTDVYLRSFFSDANVRPSCYDCKFKKRYRETDFTLWDCFDVFKFSKELDNDKGVSRVLVHTGNAEKIWRELACLKCVEIDADKAVEDVREMTHSIAINRNRNRFFDEINIGHVAAWNKCYPVTFRTRFERAVRIVLAKTGVYSTLKRIAKTFIKNLKRV
jgi:NAD-dependent dihydropyrimidine dehydrogenase PreA subunit